VLQMGSDAPRFLLVLLLSFLSPIAQLLSWNAGCLIRCLHEKSWGVVLIDDDSTSTRSYVAVHTNGWPMQRKTGEGDRGPWLNGQGAELWLEIKSPLALLNPPHLRDTANLNRNI